MIKEYVFKPMDLLLPEGVTPQNIDWSHFDQNRPVLWGHDWAAPPIGYWLPVNQKTGKGYPVLHELTPMSRMIINLDQRGIKLQAGAGGEVRRDQDGNVTKFFIYEISLFA